MSEIDLNLKSLIRIRIKLTLVNEVLFRRTVQANSGVIYQLIIPRSHRSKAMEGCHDHV